MCQKNVCLGVTPNLHQPDKRNSHHVVLSTADVTLPIGASSKAMPVRLRGRRTSE